MDLISTEELRAKLDRGDDFELVMVLGEWEYLSKHIPGSRPISTAQRCMEELDPRDEIVLYDSSPYCVRSRRACKILSAHGYECVRRYAGGLEEWESAGYPLEGEQVLGGRRGSAASVHALFPAA